MPSIAVEDYLKTIYSLTKREEPASTSAIAEKLGIAAGSVTGMVKRLAEQGLVEHVPYYGARLTSAGHREAVRLIRRHRVLELFLVQVLGYTWDRVHDVAERLEHASTDELIDRMAAVLGEPGALMRTSCDTTWGGGTLRWRIRGGSGAGSASWSGRRVLREGAAPALDRRAGGDGRCRLRAFGPLTRRRVTRAPRGPASTRR